MTDFWKSNSSIASALIALGIDPSARFRLTDIIPEEISIVNRAANKRRFLVVKKLEGAQPMKTTVKKASIPKPVHAAMMRALTESLERLVSVVNGVKGADLTDEQMDPPIPAELSNEVSAIAQILTGLVEAYPSPTAKDELGTSTEAGPAQLSQLGTEAADKLKVLAAAIAQIAEAESPEALALIAQRMVDTAKSAGVVAKMQEFANALIGLAPEAGAPATTPVVPPPDPSASAVGGTVPVPAVQKTGAQANTAPAQTTESQPPATTVVDPLVEQPLAEPPKEDENIECDTTVAKAAEAIALSLTEVAKVGAKMSGARLQRLRMAAQTLVELIDELGRTSSEKSAGGQPAVPATTPQAITPSAVLPPAANPVAVVQPPAVPPVAQPEMVTKAEYDALANKVNKLLEQPVPPASRREGVSTGAGHKSPTSQPTTKRSWIV